MTNSNYDTVSDGRGSGGGEIILFTKPSSVAFALLPLLGVFEVIFLFFFSGINPHGPQRIQGQGMHIGPEGDHLGAIIKNDSPMEMVEY